MTLPNGQHSQHSQHSQPDIERALYENPVLAASLAYPHRRVDAVEALDVLAACDGNLILTAARLKASPQSILASVVGDDNGHALLSRYLRAFTMSKTFGLVARLHDALIEAIDEDNLKPDSIARTLVALVQGMASLTDANQAAPMDPFTALMKVLPAEEREALKTLVNAATAVPAA